MKRMKAGYRRYVRASMMSHTLLSAGRPPRRWRGSRAEWKDTEGIDLRSALGLGVVAFLGYMAFKRRSA